MSGLGNSSGGFSREVCDNRNVVCAVYSYCNGLVHIGTEVVRYTDSVCLSDGVTFRECLSGRKRVVQSVSPDPGSGIHTHSSVSCGLRSGKAPGLCGARVYIRSAKVTCSSCGSRHGSSVVQVPGLGDSSEGLICVVCNDRDVVHSKNGYRDSGSLCVAGSGSNSISICVGCGSSFCKTLIIFTRRICDGAVGVDHYSSVCPLCDACHLGVGAECVVRKYIDGYG